MLDALPYVQEVRFNMVIVKIHCKDVTLLQGSKYNLIFYMYRGDNVFSNLICERFVSPQCCNMLQ